MTTTTRLLLKTRREQREIERLMVRGAPHLQGQWQRVKRLRAYLVSRLERVA